MYYLHIASVLNQQGHSTPAMRYLPYVEYSSIVANLSLKTFPHTDIIQELRVNGSCLLEIKAVGITYDGTPGWRTCTSPAGLWAVETPNFSLQSWWTEKCEPVFTLVTASPDLSCLVVWPIVLWKRTQWEYTHKTVDVNGQSNTHVLLPWQRKANYSEVNKKQEVASFRAVCQVLWMTKAHSTSLFFHSHSFNVTLTP